MAETGTRPCGPWGCETPAPLPKDKGATQGVVPLPATSLATKPGRVRLWLGPSAPPTLSSVFCLLRAPAPLPAVSTASSRQFSLVLGTALANCGVEMRRGAGSFRGAAMAIGTSWGSGDRLNSAGGGLDLGLTLRLPSISHGCPPEAVIFLS